MMNQRKIADYRQLAEKKDEYLKFEGSQAITWCEGCGNYAIQKALERALVLEGFKTSDVLFCFDVGCSGNGSDKIAAMGGTTLHGLHGRVISLAAGAALANPRIKVIAEAGDGATFSEGPGHLIHAVRSNYPMLFILHNNENFALTTGQASALTRKGFPMNGSPDGVMTDPMNACDFVLGLKPTFVARSFSGDINHMTEILRAALRHNGFALVEMLQLCPTYNRTTSSAWFRERIQFLKSVPKTIEAARKAAADLERHINLGILYQDTKSPNFLERLPTRKGVKTALVDEVKAYDIGKLTAQFK